MKFLFQIVIAVLLSCSLFSQDTAKKKFKEGDPFSVIKQLNLSRDQRDQLREIMKDFRAELKKTMESDAAGKNPLERQKNRSAIRSELMLKAYDRALNILDKKQRLKILEISSESENLLGSASGKTINSQTLEAIKSNSKQAVRKSVSNPTKLDSFFNNTTSLINDQHFARRVYLDLTGRLPTVDQLLNFFEDKNPKKRLKLIDNLLASEEFATYQTLRWGDALRIKSEFPINLWPNAAAVYSRWIKNSILQNVRYNHFVYQLITASGSNFRNPPSNFLRATQANDPYSLAEAVTISFMGDELMHFPQKIQDDFKVVFESVSFKPTSEWKEQIVYWNRKEPSKSKLEMPDGTTITINSQKDPRRAFAEWLTAKENPYLAKAYVNRIWYWVFGKPIIGTPDKFSNTKEFNKSLLLNYLAKEFVKSGYNIKGFYRMIMSSRVYQSSSPNYRMRAYDAEILQDVLCQVFGTEVKYMSDTPEPFSFYPPQMPTIELADGSITSKLLETFGRPSRDTGFEYDRIKTATESQRLFLINSTEINGWIDKSWILRTLPLDNKNLTQSLQYLWLNTLSRYPNKRELEAAGQIIKSSKEKQRQTLQDLCWSLINSEEFGARY